MQTNPYTTRTDYVDVDGKQIATDQEGYIQDMGEWSEGFATAIAEKEGIPVRRALGCHLVYSEISRSASGASSSARHDQTFQEEMGEKAR